MPNIFETKEVKKELTPTKMRAARLRAIIKLSKKGK